MTNLRSVKAERRSNTITAHLNLVLKMDKVIFKALHHHSTLVVFFKRILDGEHK